jgi:hypothetical protein
VNIRVIFTRNEAEDALIKEAEKRLAFHTPRHFDADVTQTYSYGEVTVTFTPKKAEPEPVPMPVHRPATDEEIRETWKRTQPKPSLSSIETITDVSLIPAAVSESGV